MHAYIQYILIKYSLISLPYNSSSMYSHTSHFPPIFSFFSPLIHWVHLMLLVCAHVLDDLVYHQQLATSIAEGKWCTFPRQPTGTDSSSARDGSSWVPLWPSYLAWLIILYVLQMQSKQRLCPCLYAHWLFPSFCTFFCNESCTLGRRSMIYAPFRTVHFTFSYSLLLCILTICGSLY